MTTTLFWTIDPKTLIGSTDILPSLHMTLEEKMNAISRMVIGLTLFGFLLTQRPAFLLVGALTLAILAAVYKIQMRGKQKGLLLEEGFANPKLNRDSFHKEKGNYQLDQDAATIGDLLDTAPITLDTVPRQNYHAINKKNPMGNVLLTDITDDPNRKSAPPAFNPDIYEDINAATKKQTQYLNPGIKNTDKQLYGDLGDNFKFDTEMMRNFYSTANTRVANDQGAFAQFLYGDMPSGKSSGPDGAFARVQDNPRYNLY
jgi:hypothetical protein